MKISICTPCFNEEENLEKYFDGILNLDYPLENLEFIIIDDHSTDRSFELLKEFEEKNQNLQIKIFQNKINSGHLFTRGRCVEEAKYDNILFIDSHSIIHKNALLELEKLIDSTGCPVVIGHPVTEDKSLVQRFFTTIRMKIYGEKNISGKFKDTLLTKKNFNILPKGMSPFFIKKSIYLNAVPKNLGRHESDDTKLIYNIFSLNEKIIRTSKVKVTYIARTNIFKEIPHIYKRGPKFVDFYFRKGSKYYPLFLLLLFLTFAAPVIIILLSVYIGLINFLLGFSTLLFLLNLSISLWFSRKPQNIFTVFILLPIIASSFIMGIYKGFLLKLFSKK